MSNSPSQSNNNHNKTPAKLIDDLIQASKDDDDLMVDKIIKSDLFLDIGYMSHYYIGKACAAASLNNSIKVVKLLFPMLRKSDGETIKTVIRNMLEHDNVDFYLSFPDFFNKNSDYYKNHVYNINDFLYHSTINQNNGKVFKLMLDSFKNAQSLPVENYLSAVDFQKSKKLFDIFLNKLKEEKISKTADFKFKGDIITHIIYEKSRLLIAKNDKLSKVQINGNEIADELMCLISLEDVENYSLHYKDIISNNPISQKIITSFIYPTKEKEFLSNKILVNSKTHKPIKKF